MSSFILKIIAIISMTFDHFSTIALQKYTFMNYIGRIAFPIFAFQLVISYRHTHNLNKMLKRLFLFALISEIPFYLGIHNLSKAAIPLNIMFTFVFAIIALYIYDFKNDFNYIKNTQELLSKSLHEKSYKLIKLDKHVFNLLKFLAILLILTIAVLVHTDYSALGIILVLLIHIFYKDDYPKVYYILATLIWSCLYILSNQLPINLLIYVMLGFIITLFYNNEKGPNIKYFFYVYYPVHILIFYLLNIFIFAR